MRAFRYERAATPRNAIAALVDSHAEVGTPGDANHYLAGGTTLIDLMKLDVIRPSTIVDINPLGGTPFGRVEARPDTLRLGALARMAEVADHPAVRRDYPVIAQSLHFAASQQLRNMASLGGNVLQRTRCSYFRDTSYAQCNKRVPGSGCAALDGFNRAHAILGVSEQCVATYPGDFAQALIALDAVVEVEGPHGQRQFPFANLHREPESRPDLETILAPGELITSFTVPARPWLRRSLYLKIRDRESYEFALASAAVVLDLDGTAVREARIALGGVATVPWRAKSAEAALIGKPLDDAAATAAADAAFTDARTRKHNEFKVALGKRTLTRALLAAAAMEI